MQKLRALKVQNTTGKDAIPARKGANRDQAIRIEPPGTVIEPSVGEVVPDLSPSELARRILEGLEIPIIQGNLQSVLAAIECVGKAKQIVANHAAAFLYVQAMKAKGNGERVDKFWFEDARWRPATPSKQQQRDANNRRILEDWFGADVGSSSRDDQSRDSERRSAAVGTTDGNFR